MFFFSFTATKVNTKKEAISINIWIKNIRAKMLSAIGKHLAEAHRRFVKPKESQFRILRKC